MVTNAAFRNLVLEFAGVSEAPHFDRIAIKTKNKEPNCQF
jgi:hypothetical protein